MVTVLVFTSCMLKARVQEALKGIEESWLSALEVCQEVTVYMIRVSIKSVLF